MISLVNSDTQNILIFFIVHIELHTYITNSQYLKIQHICIYNSNIINVDISRYSIGNIMEYLIYLCSE